MFLICCIDTLNDPAALAISGGNIPSKYAPNPCGMACTVNGLGCVICSVLD